MLASYFPEWPTWIDLGRLLLWPLVGVVAFAALVAGLTWLSLWIERRRGR